MTVDPAICELAIDQARRSQPEDNRPRPKVGAVAVIEGSVRGMAYRGEGEAGQHAEYFLLEHKLRDVDLKGATIYTTLEPCTKRSPPKVACADRLIERNVREVVIGMLDPNPDIRGLGVIKLREAGVNIALFPTTELAAAAEELNREFTQYHYGPDVTLPADFISGLCEQSLDEWYRTVNSIYWNRNYTLSRTEIFAHLVEVCGSIGLLASNKVKEGVDPVAFVPKALAWWMALCGKLGVRSVEDLLWTKFPGVCTYCLSSPHESSFCAEQKLLRPGADWGQLATIAAKNRASRPFRISEWQQMFFRIYPERESFGKSFARLVEELGELAESVRIFEAAPGYFASEAADLFAWLMHIQNSIDASDINARGIGEENSVELAFARGYPDRCVRCRSSSCKCPPIAFETVGRIAREMPPSVGTESGFLSPDQALRKFRRF